VIRDVCSFFDISSELRSTDILDSGSRALQHSMLSPESDSGWRFGVQGGDIAEPSRTPTSNDNISSNIPVGEKLQMTDMTIATTAYSASALFKRAALQIPSIRRLRDQRDQLAEQLHDAHRQRDQLTKELLAARRERGGAQQTIACRQSVTDRVDPMEKLSDLASQQTVSESRAQQENYFAGDFGSWAEASAVAGQGYAASEILEKVRASALKAKRGEIAFERDSIAFATREVHWPLLTCICTAALHSQVGRFHLLDFGGSLGSTYFQHRPELSEIPGLQWSIVEQPHFVDCGQREFQDDVLQFFDTIGNAARRAPVDLAIFSGSLQSVSDPFRVLENAVDTGARYLLLDRLPITDGDRDLITLIHVVHPAFYSARLPIRAFSKRRLFEKLAELGYGVLWEFRALDGDENNWEYRGIFCKHL
jgi:putative methyltransferase (TIGR04325 family)